MSNDISLVIDEDYIATLEETNVFVDEDGYEYRLHDKTNFKVEVFSCDDLNPYGRVYWAGIEPTYYPTYHEALARLSAWLLRHAEIRGSFVYDRDEDAIVPDSDDDERDHSHCSIAQGLHYC